MIGERPKRKPFGKKIREEVYAKCNGHCAYCGCEITLKEMQIDHLEPFYNGGKDDLDNLMPTCRQCNYYKGTLSLKGFRQTMSRIINSCQRSFVFRLAVKYGIVSVNKWDERFYFEKQEEYDMDGFTGWDLDFVKSLNGEKIEGVPTYYFADYNDNKLHIWMYGKKNGVYFAEVGDSFGNNEGWGDGETLKKAIQAACENYKTKNANTSDTGVKEALESIEKLQEVLK